MILVSDEDYGAELATAHQLLAKRDSHISGIDHFAMVFHQTDKVPVLSHCQMTKYWKVRQVFLRTCQDLGTP